MLDNDSQWDLATINRQEAPMSAPRDRLVSDAEGQCRPDRIDISNLLRNDSKKLLSPSNRSASLR